MYLFKLSFKYILARGTVQNSDVCYELNLGYLSTSDWCEDTHNLNIMHLALHKLMFTFVSIYDILRVKH